MTATIHEWETLTAADGTELSVFVARPAAEGDHYRGVIVLQEIWGVNAHIRDVCDRLARLGYTVVSPDLFHRSQPRFDAPYTDTSGREHAAKLTPAGVRADLEATHAFLRARLEVADDDPRIAACGFCMGGRLAFVANAILPLTCAISFYGGGLASQLALSKDQHGPLLLFWGGKDAFIGKADRRAVADSLEDAGKRFTEVNVGHADHGFFCDARKSYDKEAAREAWGLTTAFLATNLDG